MTICREMRLKWIPLLKRKQIITIVRLYNVVYDFVHQSGSEKMKFSDRTHITMPARTVRLLVGIGIVMCCGR